MRILWFQNLNPVQPTASAGDGAYLDEYLRQIRRRMADEAYRETHLAAILRVIEGLQPARDQRSVPTVPETQARRDANMTTERRADAGQAQRRLIKRGEAL